jgi:catechol 2,3-dioxygenase-like lactoylglutathione lyase family enzyme
MSTDKPRVTGIGGIFFKCRDRDAQNAWYRRHLGIDAASWGTTFRWRHDDDPDRRGYTVWSAFKGDTDYLDPSPAPFMINYRVHDLPGLLEALKAEGVEQVGELVREDYGLFAWILDPEGNKIELWEPDDEAYARMLGGEGPSAEGA